MQYLIKVFQEIDILMASQEIISGFKDMLDITSNLASFSQLIMVVTLFALILKIFKSGRSLIVDNQANYVSRLYKIVEDRIGCTITVIFSLVGVRVFGINRHIYELLTLRGPATHICVLAIFKEIYYIYSKSVFTGGWSMKKCTF